METAFYQYVNLRVIYGYSFEESVNMYLNDDYYTAEEKNAVWVNTARNRIILGRTNAQNTAQLAQATAQIATNMAQLAQNIAQLAVQMNHTG